ATLSHSRISSSSPTTLSLTRSLSFSHCSLSSSTTLTHGSLSLLQRRISYSPVVMAAGRRHGGGDW
ncbi:hypothetical protein A2U01_0098771, partial [Trifolium medium]|nr:hypothetical protein [Trifolium medium]